MKFKLILTLIILAMIPALGFSQVQLPDFSFTDLDGNAFTNSSLDSDKPVFVMMFDPYCDHCETQADNIAEQADKFRAKGVQFMWVTLEPDPEALARFRDKHFGGTGLEDSLHFLMDQNVMFEDYFGYTDESINIYCFKPDGSRPKYFGEEQEAASLLKYL